MSWNYRIVRYRGSDGYGLHEVFYNDAGEAWSMTERPVGFAGESVDDVKLSVALALKAFKRPVFDEPEKWAQSIDDNLAEEKDEA